MQIDLGIAILRNILQIGFLLAPENVSWDVPRTTGEVEKVSFLQKRMCFTELAPEELLNHSKQFGPFALEIDISALRRLGALPAFYVPQALQQNPQLSVVGPALLHQMRWAEYGLSTLTNFFAATKSGPIAPGAPFSFPSIKGLPDWQLPAELVRDFLARIEALAGPLELLHGAAWAATQMFYPTDDTRHTGLEEELAYYRQREWRLIGGVSTNGDKVSRLLRSEEIARLLLTDQAFWSGKLNGRTRAELAEVIPLDAILFSRILVPEGAQRSVKEFVGDRFRIATLQT